METKEMWKDSCIKIYSTYITTKQRILSYVTEDKKAQGVIEYGLILALVALALVGSMDGMKNAISQKFAEAISVINGAKGNGRSS